MAGYTKPQVQGFVSKSTVKAEFVDEIPESSSVAKLREGRTSWQQQEGVKEALSKAFANPGRKMILVDYDQCARSTGKKNAYLRTLSLDKQGYNERNGWIVKAVDTKVYVCYMGADDGG